MTIDQLWETYQKKRTDKCRNDLVLHYMPLVNFHVNKMQRKSIVLHKDELMGAACEGLIKAVERFDPTCKLKFQTFSGYRIRGAMQDWLRSLDKQSRTVRVFEKHKRKVQESLIHNGYYDSRDVARKMEVSDERYDKLNELLVRGKEVHFSTLVNDTYSNPWEFKSPKEPNPAHTTEQRFFRELVSKALCRVDRMIVILYYFDGLTLREISEILGVCESQISFLRIRAVSRITSKLKHEAVLSGLK